jgi:hypothetical protein
VAAAAAEGVCVCVYVCVMPPPPCHPAAFITQSKAFRSFFFSIACPFALQSVRLRCRRSKSRWWSARGGRVACCASRLQRVFSQAVEICNSLSDTMRLACRGFLFPLTCQPSQPLSCSPPPPHQG